MSENWKTFLLSQQASVTEQSCLEKHSDDKTIYPLTHLTVLKVSGKDAAKLLQGQVTCNVNDITETKSSLAAMCNLKGRVIATLLLVKNADAYLLVLPVDLSETVRERLRMYILRSDAKVTDASDEFCLLGLCGPGQPEQRFATASQQDIRYVNFSASANRKLLIAGPENASQLWSEKVGSENFHGASPDEWQCLDILSGIPWVTAATSEEFIPQMLNLDKLGGISFNKGCYTGQEIVARTHYLGKAKRELFLAECKTVIVPEPNSNIVNNSEDQEIVGKVLSAQHTRKKFLMLVVLPTGDYNCDHLSLQEDNQSKINVIPFSYG